MDYDRVLVLDHGNIAEYDAPHILLSKTDGGNMFAKMVDETGDGNAAILRELARLKSERPGREFDENEILKMVAVPVIQDT
jgi:hypothetical protein